MLHRRTALGLFASAAAVRSARGAGLAAPAGNVILTLRGRIAAGNTQDGAQFDIAMLDALLQGRFEGETPWTHGRSVFTGPLMAAVLDAAGAGGDSMRVTALNDYSADIPLADIRAYPVILASRHNGAPMSVRDKGPLWVIYPMDTNPALRNETIYTRSVWQVSSIEVR